MTQALLSCLPAMQGVVTGVSASVTVPYTDTYKILGKDGAYCNILKITSNRYEPQHVCSTSQAGITKTYDLYTKAKLYNMNYFFNIYGTTAVTLNGNCKDIPSSN